MAEQGARKLWIGLAVGCGVLVVAGVAAVVAFFGWLVYGTEARDVEVTVVSPASVARGERFLVQATVKNLAGRPRQLVDLDVAASFLAGIAIEEMTPPSVDSTQLPFDDTVSYSLDRPLEGNGELAIEILALALHEGDYAGNFDFCIDSEYRCVSQYVRTVVTAAAASAD